MFLGYTGKSCEDSKEPHVVKPETPDLEGAIDAYQNSDLQVVDIFHLYWVNSSQLYRELKKREVPMRGPANKG